MNKIKLFRNNQFRKISLNQEVFWQDFGIYIKTYIYKEFLEKFFNYKTFALFD